MCDYNRVRRHLTNRYMECECQSESAAMSNESPVCWECGICKTCAQKIQVRRWCECSAIRGRFKIT
jgi:hypothetical protein